MGQKIVLDETDARAMLTCLQMCKNKEATRLIELISEKVRTNPQMDLIRQEAIEHYQEEGKIEIDEGATVSIDDSPGAEITGAYVMGWVWVDLPATEDDKAAPS